MVEINNLIMRAIIVQHRLSLIYSVIIFQNMKRFTSNL